MKDSKLTSLFCYAVIFIIWLTPATKMLFNLKAVCCVIFFFLGCVIWYFIKDKKVAVVLDLIVIFIAIIFSYEYIFVAMPINFLIISLFFIYNEKDQKNKKFKSTENIEWSNLFATAAVLVFIVKVVYAFIRLQTDIGQNMENLSSAIKTVCFMVIFFSALIVILIKSEKLKKTSISNNLKKIYIISVFGIVISAFYYYAVNPFSTYSPRIEFIYWLAMIIYMAHSGDPIIRLILKKLQIKTK